MIMTNHYDLDTIEASMEIESLLRLNNRRPLTLDEHEILLKAIQTICVYGYRQDLDDMVDIIIENA